MTERSFNLVVPLAHEATAMRTTDTAGSALLGNALRKRGQSIKSDLTKTYRRQS